MEELFAYPMKKTFLYDWVLKSISLYNFLRAAYSPILYYLKITNSNCSHRKASKIFMCEIVAQ